VISVKFRVLSAACLSTWKTDFFSTKHLSCVQVRWTVLAALAGWLDSESESATSTVVAVLCQL
jgi:hypothetical protein